MCMPCLLSSAQPLDLRDVSVLHPERSLSKCESEQQAPVIETHTSVSFLERVWLFMIVLPLLELYPPIFHHLLIQPFFIIFMEHPMIIRLAHSFLNLPK